MTTVAPQSKLFHHILATVASYKAIHSISHCDHDCLTICQLAWVELEAQGTRQSHWFWATDLSLYLYLEMRERLPKVWVSPSPRSHCLGSISLLDSIFLVAFHCQLYWVSSLSACDYFWPFISNWIALWPSVSCGALSCSASLTLGMRSFGCVLGHPDPQLMSCLSPGKLDLKHPYWQRSTSISALAEIENCWSFLVCFLGKRC